MALQELLDRNELQRLQDGFCKVSGISAYCLNHEGTKITRISGDDRYYRGLQEQLALERVMGVDSIEDMAVEELEGHKQVAAVAIQARGEKELYWIVYKPEEMSEDAFYQITELLRDASISFLQGKLQAYGLEAENIRNQTNSQKMDRSVKMNQAMARIVQLLDSMEPVEGIMNEWLSVVSSFMELDTAQIFKLQEGGKFMDVICEWRKAGLASAFDRTSHLPAYAFLKAERPLIVNADTILDPEFRDVYKLGVKAMMLFPVGLKESGFVVSLNHRQGHAFTKEEDSFASDAVKILNNVLTRRIQKNSLNSAYNSMETVLDGLNTCVMIRTDGGRRILYVNRPFQETFPTELKKDDFSWLLNVGEKALMDDKKAEASKKASKDQVKAAVAQDAPSGLSSADMAEGKGAACENPSEGASPDMMEGKGAAIENPSEGTASDMMGNEEAASEAEEAVTQLERREVYYREKERWYDLTVSEVRWVDGNIVRMYSMNDITLKKNYQGKIEQQAYMDFLTGLYNRICCERDLAAHIESAVKQKKTGALLYLDLDDFKHINEGLGHQYGDALLKAISHAFQRIPGIETTCYRMGGDEFVIVVPPESYDRIEIILEDIQQIFTKPWFLKDSDYYCTMSMGAITFPDGGESVTDLVKKADIAMYAAKKAGKNRIQFYNNGSTSAERRRLDIGNSMREATAKNFGEFEVFYQPIMNVWDGEPKCAGAEALVRWNSTNLGFLSSSEFIPLAEYLGLINPIGNHVLLEACKQCKEWNDKGFDYKVNVNLSVIQLLQNDIVEIVENALKETGLQPKHLTLEVTESLAINDMERMKNILNRIRELGVTIALDDFGTGYSSLNHVHEIAFDTIKVDQSFVKDLAEDSYSKHFIRLVSELAETLGASICVEGVENLRQYNIVKEMKIKYIQGFYFDRPMPARDFERKYCRSIAKEEKEAGKERPVEISSRLEKKQDKARQDKARQDKAGQDKAGQDKAGQDITERDKFGQDKPRQEKETTEQKMPGQKIAEQKNVEQEKPLPKRITGRSVGKKEEKIISINRKS